jgi:signal transduction histidine kinase
VRRRYLRSTLLIVLVGMAVLAVVMAVASSRGIRDEAEDRLTAEAQRIAMTVGTRVAAGLPVDAEFVGELVPADRAVRVTLSTGEVVEAGTAVGDDALSARVAVSPAGTGWVAVLESPDRVRQSQLVSAVSILAIVLAVGLLAAVLAVRESRRLTRPLAELADRAARLGSGDLRPSGQRFGVPELDQVAEALDDTAVELGAAAEESRARVVDASHQLRTPLTALSIRLEEISHAGDLAAVQDEAGAALQQVERLTGVVDAMLVASGASGRSVQQTMLSDVLRQQVGEWSPSYAAVGRVLTAEGRSGLAVQAPSGAVSQILATLVENSLIHGAGCTRLVVRRAEGAVVVEVGDEGSGVPAELAPHVFERSISGGGGSGVGLAVARTMAESVGGRLELTTRSPATFSLFLRPVNGAIR